MTTCLGRSCSFALYCAFYRVSLSICSEGGMLDLIVLFLVLAFPFTFHRPD